VLGGTTLRHRLILSTLVILAAFVPTAHRTLLAGPAINSGISEISFDASDHGFTGPETVQAGVISIRVVNKGKDIHHAVLLRLEDGKSAEDFFEAVQSDPAYFVTKHLDWIAFAGGPNAVIPGQSSSAVVELKPGSYMVVCIIPNPNGILHVRQGMMKPLTVTGPPVVGISEPEAKVTITARDFDFKSDRPVAAGRQTIRFVNAGTQPHEVVVVRLIPGKTLRDFAATFTPFPEAVRNGTPMGGLSGIESGGHGFFTINFVPGHYGLICFLSDRTKLVPHFTLGMMYEFDVK
jgi:plastocyanin